MFIVACVTSPCCTPLIVPLGIALLAGTPFALWLSAHLGWVYGGLTLVSVISLVLGLRWMGQRAETKQSGNTESQGRALPVQKINSPKGV
jgi:predicted MFS family arabinose efflux permease